MRKTIPYLSSTVLSFPQTLAKKYCKREDIKNLLNAIDYKPCTPMTWRIMMVFWTDRIRLIAGKSLNRGRKCMFGKKKNPDNPKYNSCQWVNVHLINYQITSESAFVRGQFIQHSITQGLSIQAFNFLLHFRSHSPRSKRRTAQCSALSYMLSAVG